MGIRTKISFYKNGRSYGNNENTVFGGLKGGILLKGEGARFPARVGLPPGCGSAASPAFVASRLMDA